MALAAFESELTAAVDRIWPSVVRIDRFARSFEDRSDPRALSGSGSGLIWDSDGVVVTNDHVVEDASRIAVTMASGETAEGRLLGRDPLTDLAAIRVPLRDLPVAPRGESATLRVGQVAIAIGNTLGLPGGPTVSLGVVSALNRPLPGSDYILEGLIQTDAAINPGNSGGPLVDLHGSVIGLNSAVVPFAQGVGFAVPVDTVTKVVRELRSTGRVVRPWIGVQGVGVDAAVARRFGLKRNRGVLVWETESNGPAHAAGIRRGDVITRMGTTGLRGFHDLVATLSQLSVGGSVDVTVDRLGREITTVLRLEEKPAAA